MENHCDLPENVHQLIIYTGNLMTGQAFKRSASQSPTDEVVQSISHVLKKWSLKREAGPYLETEQAFVCNDNKLQLNGTTERKGLKLTVKMFLNTFEVSELREALNSVINFVNEDKIDSFILACPPSNSKLTLSDLQPLWALVEEYVGEKLDSVGISDLDTTQLVDLYNWAKVKPCINQVNLDSCCAIPPEMTAFASEKGIQLLTHNDPKTFFTRSNLQTATDCIISKNLHAWDVRWTVRFTVMVKLRGITQNKGYIVCAAKNDL